MFVWTRSFASSALDKRVFGRLRAEARKYPLYNFREWAQRRIDHDLDRLQACADNVQRAAILSEAQAFLGQLKRMRKTAQLYAAESDRLVVEENRDNDS